MRCTRLSRPLVIRNTVYMTPVAMPEKMIPNDNTPLTQNCANIGHGKYQSSGTTLRFLCADCNAYLYIIPSTYANNKQ